MAETAKPKKRNKGKSRFSFGSSLKRFAQIADEEKDKAAKIKKKDENGDLVARNADSVENSGGGKKEEANKFKDKGALFFHQVGVNKEPGGGEGR